MKRLPAKLISRAPDRTCVPILLALSLLLLGIIVEQTNSFVLKDAPSHSPLRVASFNIRQFGRTKMSRSTVVHNIIGIFRRYDLVFVMETRDSSKKSLKRLRSRLGHKQWNYTASVPIGRSSYKEQYVYWYRPAVVKLLKAQLYDDSADDFEREPYMAQFEYWSQASASKVNVTFVGIHIKPEHAVQEIADLPETIQSAKQVFPDSNGVIAMGDFNADCSYMNNAERHAALLLNTPSEYTSYVGDDADTTVSHKTNCAYDRIVVPSQGQDEVKVANVKVFDFEEGLGLSLYTAHRVSDHYPVEFTLE